MEMSFKVNTNILRTIQQLVKKYDGRFIGNPYPAYNDKSRVTISFDNVENANKFDKMLNICVQPYF